MATQAQRNANKKWRDNNREKNNEYGKINSKIWYNQNKDVVLQYKQNVYHFKISEFGILCKIF